MAESAATNVLMGRSLVSFSSGLADREQNDIAECLKWSENRADRSYDRRAQWKQWINRYQAGLFKSGFRLSGVLDGNTVQIRHPRELPIVLATAIQTSGHPELGVLSRKALESLLGGVHAASFFENWFSRGSTETLQLVPCHKDGNGQAHVMICGMKLVTETVAGSWFSAPDSTLTLSVNGGAYLYDADAYEPYRAKVRSQLERDIRTYFESI